MSSSAIHQTYGSKLRTRVCGILVQDDRLLMVEHSQLKNRTGFWIPPGGGVEYGESLEKSLIREFREETGLVVQVVDYLFLHEFIYPPLHAIEFFFVVKKLDGKLKTGIDPEIAADSQIISNVEFLTIEEIFAKGIENIHQIFRYCVTINDLLSLKGHFKSLKSN